MKVIGAWSLFQTKANFVDPRADVYMLSKVFFFNFFVPIFFCSRRFLRSADVSEDDGVEGGKKNGPPANFLVHSTVLNCSPTFSRLRFATKSASCVMVSALRAIKFMEDEHLV